MRLTREIRDKHVKLSYWLVRCWRQRREFWLSGQIAISRMYLKAQTLTSLTGTPGIMAPELSNQQQARSSGKQMKLEVLNFDHAYMCRYSHWNYIKQWFEKNFYFLNFDTIMIGNYCLFLHSCHSKKPVCTSVTYFRTFPQALK